MSHTLVVVNRKKDWDARNPGELVSSFPDYVTGNYPETRTRPRIINLCRSYRYLSEGYYCSLLAEARGDKVIPSVRTLSELGRRSLYRIHVDDIDEVLFKALNELGTDPEVEVLSFFGRTRDPRFGPLARKLFEAYPCPILAISLRRRKRWEIAKLRPISPRRLNEAEMADFSEALIQFSRKLWRTPSKRRAARYDLAILCDPQESMPPSDTRALKRFIRAGRQLGINCELITQRDYLRLAEFDGLFIRATTSIDNFTYRFAKKAESEGLTTIDDSTSILRCTNKIYLADLFRTHGVPSPKTVVLYKDRHSQLRELEASLGFPVVVKIPDGAFSRGVEKARDFGELESICKRLFRHSTLLLAQEFLYTDFDWRVGILDNKLLYACRYYMVKHHWQIYRHGRRTSSGGFDTLPVEELPQAVSEAALRATGPIGDGFYGVDVKEKDDKGYVIEVNDNPSIESGIEDRFLGMELYRSILATMLERMEARRK